MREENIWEWVDQGIKQVESHKKALPYWLKDQSIPFYAYCFPFSSKCEVCIHKVYCPRRGNYVYIPVKEVMYMMEKPYDIELMTGKEENKVIQSDTKIFILEYDFEVVTVNLEVKEVRHKLEVFLRFEDLLAQYRKKKNAQVMGLINYCKNFKVHVVTELKEMPIEQIDLML